MSKILEDELTLALWPSMISSTNMFSVIFREKNAIISIFKQLGQEFVILPARSPNRFSGTFFILGIFTYEPLVFLIGNSYCYVIFAVLHYYN